MVRVFFFVFEEKKLKNILKILILYIFKYVLYINLNILILDLYPILILPPRLPRYFQGYTKLIDLQGGNRNRVPLSPLGGRENRGYIQYYSNIIKYE